MASYLKPFSRHHINMLVQLFFHIVGYDIWFYLSHQALHTQTLRWIHRNADAALDVNAFIPMGIKRKHLIHHEKRRPVWYDTYHGHWLEAAFKGIGFFLPWVDFKVSVPAAVIALLFINLRAMAQHDRRCAWLVGDHHLVHHRNTRVNFGQPWLDWIGGTNSA